MVLKLYGYTQPAPAKVVAAVLHEKEIPFEYINIDLFKGEQKTPDFLAKQPFGLVPVIVSIEVSVGPGFSTMSNGNVIRTMTASSCMRVVPLHATLKRDTQIRGRSSSLLIPGSVHCSTKPFSLRSSTSTAMPPPSSSSLFLRRSACAGQN